MRLSVVLAGVIITAMLLAGCSRGPGSRRDKYLAAGKQYLEKHDYPRAVLQFQGAVQAMPNDPETHYELGIAYTGIQNYTAAVASFRNVLSLNHSHVGAQLGIAQIFAHSNNPELLKQARERLNALLQGPSVPPDTLNTLALTELELGNRDEGIQHLEQALARSPRELASSIMLARAKLESHDIKGAEEVLKRAVSAAPESAEAHRFLAAFYRTQQRLGEAEAEYRKALEINKADAMVLLDLAGLKFATGRSQEAEEIYKQAAAVEGFRHSFGVYLLQQGRYEEAIREFERLYEALPSDRQARTRLVIAYRSANRIRDAEALLDKALKKNPKDFDALLQRSELFIATWKYPQAEAALNQVLHLNGGSAQAHYVSAKLHQARSEDLSYRAELTEALRLNRELLPVRVELAESLTASKAAASAVEVLNAAPPAQRDLTAVVVTRNWAYWAAGRFTEMATGVERGLLRDSRSTDLILQDGMLKLRNGNAAAAQAAFERALKMNPQDLRALTALSQTFAAQKKPKVAVQTVRDYVVAHPNSAQAQELLGLVLLANGDRKEAREAFTAAVAADPLFARAELELARLDTTEGNWESARNRLTKLIGANPRNSTALQWLGDVEVNRGNLNAALEQYRKAADQDPKSSIALNNVAYLLTDYRKQPDEALHYAEKAAELAPGDPTVADTLGWVLYNKGLYNVAISHLKRAASHPNAVWKYHLAMAYAKAGQKEDAHRMLDAALKLDSKAPEAQAALIVVRDVK